MSTTERIPVAPSVLEWARRSAGYDRAAAAKKLGVSEARIDEWESGSSQPAIVQLRNMARHYKRPLAVMLLSAPPKDFMPIHDFRRNVDGGQRVWSPALNAELKRVLSQREVMIELAQVSRAELVDSREKLSFDRSKPAEQVAAEIRSVLGMDQWSATVIADQAKVLRAAIDAVENLGILVAQTRDVSIGEMRAFSVSEWPYPLIVLNGSDWPRPRLFSLLHELCHLALNSGGLCDLHETRGASSTSGGDEIEHYCNSVAAAALMPASKILADPLVRATVAGYSWEISDLGELGRRFGASAESVLLRLISLGRASWALYWQRKPEMEEQYADARAREKERQQSASGGPNYYVIKARNLGRSYVMSVLDAFHSRAISSLDVSDYLEVRYDQVSKLEQAAHS